MRALSILFIVASWLAVVTAGPVAENVGITPYELPKLKRLAGPVSQIEKRTGKGGMFCGNFNTGSKRDVEKCLKGMSDVPNWQCVTPAKTCRRHMCVNTTGITVCNDNDHDITLRCDTIVREMALNPAILCCTYGQGWKGISGQQFTNEGWNVIISYANCNHPTDERPSMGPPDEPWGPNGECKCC